MSDYEDTDIEQIAVVGMAGRFPGAKNINEFWKNLCDGKESVTQFSDDELLGRGVSKEELVHPDYVKSGVVLDDIDLFDAEFFGYTARQAESMDPQQRIFLEVAWEALEDAGCNPDTYDGNIGVFAGTGGNDYRKRIGADFNSIGSDLETFQSMISNDPDYLTTRVAYTLNLKGPCYTMQTACSTSLVAVHVACQNLLMYQCDTALAGGVSIRLPQGVGYRHREGMIWSRDGHCRAFDANSSGIMLGRGAGVVVLKRLSEAIEERDHIYAIIKGSAVNNDGGNKVGYTAPSVDGQATVISMAQELAGVSPESISYVETHGTGTPLGDPIEIEALTKVFRAGDAEERSCAIGSVKTNVGHLDAAAGVASLIKTSLSLEHRKIPPSLHFENWNPNILSANSPFFVNANLQEWPGEKGPLRAGVSSFGIGGTNAHIVMEAPPGQAESSAFSCQVLLLSAQYEAGVDRAAKRLAAHLEKNRDLNLADVAYTLQNGRKHFGHRSALVCEDVEQAIEMLSGVVKSVQVQEQDTQNEDIVFMFSGQGSQYITMGEGLYRNEPIFKEQVDYCSEVLTPFLGLDLCDVLFPRPENKTTAEDLLNQTRITQPALFVIEYSLVKLLESWGVQPSALVGHSVGEYVAACLAGVFSLDDVLGLVAQRGEMMQNLPTGSMLAVPLSEDELEPLLPNDLSVAVINAPTMTVVSGETATINAFKEKIDQSRDIDCRVLHTSHAFHSKMMEPILDDFTQVVEKITMGVPQIPFVSNVSGTWISDEDATSPQYWANHLRQPVRFFSCIDTLLTGNNKHFLEVGPGQVLVNLARFHPDRKDCQFFSITRRPVECKEDHVVALTCLGNLWAAGVNVDWTGLVSDNQLHKVSLPTYPFKWKRHWIEEEPWCGQFVSTSQVGPEKCQEIGQNTNNSPSFYRESKEIDFQKNDKLDSDSISEEVKRVYLQLTGNSAVEVDEDSSFYDLGVDSLLLVQFASVLEEKFNVGVSFRQLSLETPNLRSVSHFIVESVKEIAEPFVDLGNIIGIQTKGNKIPFVLVHGDAINHWFPSYIGDDQPLWGFVHQSADGEPMKHRTVEDIAELYLNQLVQQCPDGPYILAGFSFGGIVAYEMVYQLVKRGYDVPLLIMLDSVNPIGFSRKRLSGRIRGLVRDPLDKIRVKLQREIKKIIAQYFLWRGKKIPVSVRSDYILSNYNKMWSMYDPKVIDSSIVLIRVEDTDLSDKSNGWRKLIGNRLKVETVHGDHLSMVRSPEHFKEVAEIMLEKTAKYHSTHEDKTN